MKLSCLPVSKQTIRQVNLIKSELSIKKRRKFTTNQTVQELISLWKKQQQQQE